MASLDIAPSQSSFPTRNPRRRRRIEGDDSIRIQPQKKRSRVIEDDLFNVGLNGHTNQHVNGHAVRPQDDASSPSQPVAFARKHRSHDNRVILVRLKISYLHTHKLTSITRLVTIIMPSVLFLLYPRNYAVERTIVVWYLARLNSHWH